MKIGKVRVSDLTKKDIASMNKRSLKLLIEYKKLGFTKDQIYRKLSKKFVDNNF